MLLGRPMMMMGLLGVWRSEWTGWRLALAWPGSSGQASGAVPPPELHMRNAPTYLIVFCFFFLLIFFYSSILSFLLSCRDRHEWRSRIFLINPIPIAYDCGLLTQLIWLVYIMIMMIDDSFWVLMVHAGSLESASCHMLLPMATGRREERDTYHDFFHYRTFFFSFSSLENILSTWHGLI